MSLPHSKIFFFIVSVICVIACKPNSNSKTSKFIIPDEFKIESHAGQEDVILALSYKDEMRINVSQSMSDIIKGSDLYGPGAMKLSYESKFPILTQQLNGTNISEQNHYYANENIYIKRTFDFAVDDALAYFEFIALHIKEPEEYYEIQISGQKQFQDKHQTLIKSFLEGIHSSQE